MKTFRKLSFLMLCFLSISLIVISCRKDDDGGDDNGGGNSSGYSLTAKIDGNSYKSYVDPTGVIAGGTLIVQSSDTSGNSIQIQIPNFTGKGTYNSGSNDLTKGYINYMKMVSMSSVITYTSVKGSGTVEITESSDTQVKGTFKATAIKNETGSTEKVEVTEGSFIAKIQK